MPTRYLSPLHKVVLPRKAWGTKGFEFWSFLSLLLVASSPRKILELGSGRSSITFSEFAHYNHSKFVSVEMDLAWVNKARLELFYLGIDTDYVHHVPLDQTTHWFKVDLFRKLTSPHCPFDFALIDAPNAESGGSHGYRDNIMGVAEIKRCTTSCQVMIIDDTQRRHVFRTIDLLLEDVSQYIRYYYDYDIGSDFKNSLCVAVRKDSNLDRAIDAIRGMLKINLYQDFDPKRCSQD